MEREGRKPWWAAWLALCLLPALALAAGVPSLSATVAVVQRMPQPNQQAFAQLALDHLIDRFRTELRRTPGKAAGWQRGTGGFLAQLQALRAELDGGAKVRFLGGPRGSFRLLVGSRQVMLQTPREAVQSAFEQALVEDWCAMTACADAAAPTPATVLAAADVPAGQVPSTDTPAVSVAASVPVESAPVESQRLAAAQSSPLPDIAQASPRPVAMEPRPAVAVRDPDAPARRPPEPARVVAAKPAPEVPLPVPSPRPGTWSFTESAGPTFASEDGLQCVYGDSRHLKLKQAGCTAVMQDLRRVVAGLRAINQRGGVIDWTELRLEPRGLGKPAHLTVGGRAQGFEADVPHLAAAPELLALLTPWLQGRLRGQSPVGQIELPDQLSYLEANLR